MTSPPSWLQRGVPGVGVSVGSRRRSTVERAGRTRCRTRHDPAERARLARRDVIRGTRRRLVAATSSAPLEPPSPPRAAPARCRDRGAPARRSRPSSTALKPNPAPTARRPANTLADHPATTKRPETRPIGAFACVATLAGNPLHSSIQNLGRTLPQRCGPDRLRLHVGQHTHSVVDRSSRRWICRTTRTESCLGVEQLVDRDPVDIRASTASSSLIARPS